MKTPKEWLAIFADSDTAYRANIFEQDILAVQADALRHAAEIANQLNETINANEGWHILQALNAEAEKLDNQP